jgi:hypothetical protein
MTAAYRGSDRQPRMTFVTSYGRVFIGHPQNSFVAWQRPARSRY